MAWNILFSSRTGGHSLNDKNDSDDDKSHNGNNPSSTEEEAWHVAHIHFKGATR
jgi:hypothetical protein